MAEVELGLQPSILDRLIDPESAGTAILIGYDERKMLAAVRRDLEELLNTRQTHVGLPDAYEQIRKSIVAYGLPDLLTLEAITSKHREDIADKIQRIIELFEPRLKDVRVTYVPGENNAERSIKFKVDARLSVDPSPDVAFDTVLELSSGQYAIKSHE
jgi:type VI secretion system protein ImpF